VKAWQNQYDYGRRIYDPRIGKFLSTDPLTNKFPYWSPYHFSANNPIRFSDLDGAEPNNPFVKAWMTDAAITFATKPNSTKAKVYGAAMGVGGAIQSTVEGVVNLVVHPIESGKGLWRMITKGPYQMAADYAMGMAEKYGSLPGPVQEYAIKANMLTDLSLMLAPIKKSLASPAVPVAETSIVATEEVASQGKAIATQATKTATPGPTLQTTGGNTINNSKWANQLNPVALNKGYAVPVKPNGYPDFSQYLYTGGITPTGLATPLNTVRIKMTGTYTGDFSAANKAAGFTETPKGFTWHHTENMGELQLIQTEVHDAARHSGGVQLYREQHNGQGYR
jgi:hypothetical protein